MKFFFIKIFIGIVNIEIISRGDIESDVFILKLAKSPRINI